MYITIVKFTNFLQSPIENSSNTQKIKLFAPLILKFMNIHKN